MKREETIRILCDAGEFVLIGGPAMGIQGSAHLTRDIDVCYRRTYQVRNCRRPEDLYVLPELRALSELKKKTGMD